MQAMSNDCGLTTAIQIIGGKWKIDILCALNAAPRRFGRLRQLIPGISEKMLAQQLREMEADGLVHRQIHDTLPPKVVYSLTDHGAALTSGVAGLCQWGEVHQRQAVASLQLTHAAK